MNGIIAKALLKDPNVVNEINRHKWLESEKAGRDIGFETACRQWMNRYSMRWFLSSINQKINTPIRFK